jgi:hypothetical protein
MSTKLDSAIQEAVSRVASQIAAAVRQDIAAEIQRVIGGARVAGARPPATPAGRRKPRRGVADADVKRVLDFIAKNPGKRTEEIRSALELDSEYGGKLLAKLRADKKVKTRGQKRATTYAVA